MRLRQKLRLLFSDIQGKNLLFGVIGTAIVAFGLYNIHDMAGITEGGIMGLILLLEHWFGISPSYSNFVLTLICFFFGWKTLGKNFIIYSLAFVLSFSIFYRVLELWTPRIFPQIASYPWLAAVIGALFVGVGEGLSIRAGGAQTGDDALAMSFHHLLKVKLSTVYLFSDALALLLSLTYIPIERILCSVLTVFISDKTIDWVTNFKIPTRRA